MQPAIQIGCRMKYNKGDAFPTRIPLPHTPIATVTTRQHQLPPPKPRRRFPATAATFWWIPPSSRCFLHLAALASRRRKVGEYPAVSA
ncbi:hypothetical protein GWI33_007978 [Rhynchophorus ferrugineus]|uniref:Uncharacterized protein n=1 Tax=Rhynchophorus ferrugineus TaxID=354439 RepID=A0A834IJ34_RHYFE|nr:hypothetical protein GWI33_007978 [Rhynchophorus ferrugineus]